MSAALLMYDCPLAMLGGLKPVWMAADYKACPRITDGEAIINGVALPNHVIEELRMLGIPLSWYNAGELRDAIEACSYDGKLIDDPDGVHFRDQLNLTHREKSADAGEIDAERQRVRRKRKKDRDLFGNKIPSEDCDRTYNHPVTSHEESSGIYSWLP